MGDAGEPVQLGEVCFTTAPFGPYTYRIPAELTSLPGVRISVPFGKQVRVGILVSIHSGDDDPSIKSINRAIDLLPIFEDDLLQLCREIASYYLCELGEVFAIAAPTRLRPRTRAAYRLTKASRSELWLASESGPVGVLFRALAASSLTSQQVEKRFPNGGDLLNQFRRRGWVEAVDIEPVSSLPKKVEFFRWVGGEPDAAKNSLPKSSRKQQALVSLLGEAQPDGLTRKKIGEEVPTCSPALRALVERGWLERSLIYPEQQHSPSLPETAEGVPVLSPRQQEVVEAIEEALHNASLKTILMFGVTGSGKSLIYLEAIEAALNCGKGAIVLVPEISLTPQLAGRLRRRFGERVGITHSGLAAGERHRIWSEAREGRVKVVIGPRSAIFLPVRDLGLVIVDEEHDDSYKQSAPNPRYHARVAAQIRAKQAGAVLLLGSATPDVATFHQTDRGRVERLELSERHSGQTPPRVWVVKWGSPHLGSILSPQLKGKLTERLAQGEQAILLVNRRGFATWVQCPDCGTVAMCPNCDIALKYHRVGTKLSCHYCGYSQVAVDACSNCRGNRLRYQGMGTQRVERELELVFPQARLARLDVDTTRSPGSLQSILTRLANREIDILIGTQMVAKGHDFPGVTLVGILGADGELWQPDYRAVERTFRLLLQASGRTGRASAGDVVIQALDPMQPIFRWVQRADYKTFYQTELEQRKPLGYPPFGRLINLSVRGTSSEAVAVCADKLRHELTGILPERDILGPVVPSAEKLEGRYYRTLLLKLRSLRQSQIITAKEHIREITLSVGKEYRNRQVQIVIDVDPVDF